MLIILPPIIGSNAVWITPCCVGVITMIGIILYSKYLNKKSNGEYHGVYMNKTPGDNVLEYTINASCDEVNGLVSLIKNKLNNDTISDCACLSLEEFLKNIIETNDKLDTIDILLEVNEKSIKMYIKDLGIERSDDFTFKNETEFNREIDYTRVLALNSTLITINQ